MKKKVISFAEARRLGKTGFLGWMDADDPDHPLNRPMAMQDLYQAKMQDLKQKREVASPTAGNDDGNTMRIETFYPYEKGSPPPASREFVTSCFCSWGPGSDREESYFITGEDAGLGWRLWVNPYCDPDDDYYWHCVARLTSEKPLSLKRAAEALLEAVWTEERDSYGFTNEGLTIECGGILSVEEAKRISDRTLGSRPKTR